MRLKKVALAEVLELIETGKSAYMLIPIRAETTLGQLKSAGVFVTAEEETPAVEEAQPEEKPKLPPRKPRIDHGKVMALHKAGWNIGSIALEVCCSTQSVRNIIEKYEAGEANNDTDPKD